MNKILKYAFALSIGLVASYFAKADSPTPDPAPHGSELRTDMRLEIDKKTDKIHVISTTNDPDIITKTYVLKFADPYELRPYLRTAVGATKIDGGDTFVSCIKYNDGTGIVMISAEDYRFSKDDLKACGGNDTCMCIDEIVEMLDKPKITSSSGSKRWIYFPKYRSAAEIRQMAINVGLNLKNDFSELQRGADASILDPDLNAVILYSTKYNVKNIEDMVAIYDMQLPEVKVTVKAYDIDYEHDAKIGIDFQAWKNGPGSDLLSIAGRFAQGMSANAIPNATGWGKTKYVQISPRWNSRFIDFLTSRSKATSIVNSALVIRNNETGHLTNQTRVSYYADGQPLQAKVLLDYEDIYGNWYTWGDRGGTAAADAGWDDYTFRAYDSQGSMITINRSGIRGTIRIGRIKNNGDGTTPYTLHMLDNLPNTFFIKDGKNIGRKLENVYNLELYIDAAGANSNFTSWDSYTSSWNNDKQMNIQKAFMRDTQIGSYGYAIDITPSVCKNTTTLDLHLENISLIGYTENANGAAETARTIKSEFNTKLMVNNKNKQFMIGGIEKTALVQSVSKVPWLGSLPIIGYVFASESPVVKKTRIVTVVSCEHQTINQIIPPKIYGDIEKTKGILKKAPKQYHNGFDQFLLDSNKIWPDPLP